MKYEVYLTRSDKIAGIIAKAHMDKAGVRSVGYGAASHFGEVPTMYQNDKMFCCVVRYNEDADVQPYRLIIA